MTFHLASAPHEPDLLTNGSAAFTSLPCKRAPFVVAKSLRDEHDDFAWDFIWYCNRNARVLDGRDYCIALCEVESTYFHYVFSDIGECDAGIFPANSSTTFDPPRESYEGADDVAKQSASFIKGDLPKSIASHH
jgi:hypothetical protein